MKRLNPATGLPFRYGDIREDGYVFSTYLKRHKTGKFFKETWLSPEKFKTRNAKKLKYYENEVLTKKGHIKKLFKGAKERAKQKNIKFNLSLEFLESIAPEKCPVFGFNLSWGRSKKGLLKNSPALDRIVPELGYVTGNVQWLSNLANNMKQNANSQQLIQFADWIKSNNKEK